MANTFTQLYAHIVFSPRGRSNAISPIWKVELYKYIAGIIANKNQKLMAVNGMPDHIHLLIGLKPDCCLSDLIRDVKANSSRFIKDKNFVPEIFEWQKGFGAFSVGQRELTTIINYIKNQEEHHKMVSFRKEYIRFLREHEIDFKSEYIFS